MENNNDIIAALSFSMALQLRQMAREISNEASIEHGSESICNLLGWINDMVYETDENGDCAGEIRRTLMSLPLKHGHSRIKETERVINDIERLRNAGMHAQKFQVIAGPDICDQLTAEIKREVGRLWIRIADRFRVSSLIAAPAA